METKPPWQSKTLWTAAIIALASLFYPPVAEFAKNNPEMFAVVLTGVFTVLRLITKGKISIGDEPPVALKR